MGFKPINLKNDTDITITLYSSLDAGSFIEEKTVKWSDWLKYLQVPRISELKYKRGLAIYGEVKDSENKPHYRSNDNIINRSCIALDYDEISKDVDFVSKLKHRLGKVAFCIYSTHSHTPENERYRVIIPLDKPMHPQHYKGVTKLLGKHIGMPLDNTSTTVSQAMALPTIKHKNSEYIFEYNEGEIMKSDYLVETLKNHQEEQPTSNALHTKRSNDYWQSIAMGVGAGERNTVLTQVIGYLLRRYVDPSLVYGLVYGWAKLCTPPIDDKEIIKTFKSIYLKHTRKE